MQNSRYFQVLRSRILAALLHGTPARGVSQTLRRGTRNGLPNFRRGRHQYSAGRPSRWASAHILVCCATCYYFVYLFLWSCMSTIIITVNEHFSNTEMREQVIFKKNNLECIGIRLERSRCVVSVHTTSKACCKPAECSLSWPCTAITAFPCCGRLPRIVPCCCRPPVYTDRRRNAQTKVKNKILHRRKGHFSHLSFKFGTF